MLRDPERLRRLIEEYTRMKNLDGYTAHTRGQRLNAHIAEMLQCWGIRADSNFRSHGEIDFAFQLEGRHFIGEAKWEATPTDTGAIAKLQKRLRQRLGGTIGIFISMAGYSTEALSDLKDGDQLAVLCLAQDHFDAMLFGFVPPEELIGQLIRKASMRGEGYCEISQLFDPPNRRELVAAFQHPPEIGQLVLESVPDFNAYTLISDLPSGQSGVAELEPGCLLLTTTDGVFLANLEREQIRLWLNFPNCSRNPLVQPDGSVFITRKSGIARISAGKAMAVTGGLVGNICLSAGREGSVWAFANGSPPVATFNTSPRALRVTHLLGFKNDWTLRYPSGEAHVAVHIEGEQFLVCGTSIALVSPTTSEELLSPGDNYLTNPGGLTRIDNDRFLIACNNVELWELRLSSRHFRRIAKLQLNGAVHELATGVAEGGYLFSHYSNSAGQTRGIVVRLEFPRE